MAYLNAAAVICICLIFGALAAISAEKVDDALGKQLVEATNTFSVRLFKEVLSKNPGNVIISPVSVSTLLAIVQQGALHNTRLQLTQVLRAEPEQSRVGYNKLIHSWLTSGNTSLEFANGAFLHQGFDVLEEFERIVQEDFLSTIEILNFTQKNQAANIMNSWVAKKTHDTIKDLISPDALTPNTVLVLINAIYFKSLWKTPFIETNTRNQLFYKADGAVIQVPTMHLDESLKMGLYRNLKIQWLEIPFERDQFSLLIMLPFEKDGIDTLVEGFTSQDLSKITADLETTYADKVYLSLPKFKLTTQTSLVPMLKQLGLTDIFSIEKANLYKISGEPLKVSNIIQKAEIEVDEKGVTAAAATGIFFETVSAPYPFTVDHPFLVFIIDKKNSIPLFAGRVTDPSE